MKHKWMGMYHSRVPLETDGKWDFATWLGHVMHQTVHFREEGLLAYGPALSSIKCVIIGPNDIVKFWVV